MRTKILSTAFCAGAAALLWAGWAQGANCYFSAECPGQQICVDTICVEPDEALSACVKGDDSECSWDETCDEGHCKPVAVMCENPAGSCEVTSSSSECGCADGLGMGQSSGSSGGDGGGPPEKSGAELYVECVDLLERTCGTEAPNIEDYCTAEQQDWCETAIPKIEQMAKDCGIDFDGDETVSSETNESSVDPEPSDGDSDGAGRAGAIPPRPVPPPEDVPLPDLISCCRMLEQEGSDEVAACIDDLATDDCDGLEACMELGDAVIGGDGESYDEAAADKVGEGTNQNVGDGADPSVQGEDDGGCAMAPQKSPGVSVFGFISRLI